MCFIRRAWVSRPAFFMNVQQTKRKKIEMKKIIISAVMIITISLTMIQDTRAAPVETFVAVSQDPSMEQYITYLPVVIGSGDDTPVVTDSSDVTLKEMFAQHGIRFGFSVFSSSFRNPVTRQLIVDHAAVVTTENALKMEPTRPEQGVFHFWEADKIIQYSQELGIQVHGHAASYHLQNPDWLVNGSFSDNELADILENHVSTLAQRYEGQLISLDAANEAYCDGYNCGPWCALGNNYTQISFESAQNSASYPIIYNSIFSSDDECTQALNLLDQGLVDGIGIELHLNSGGWEARLARMDVFLDQIRQHGGWARFSEVGVLADEQTQATVYAAITALAVKHSDIVKDFVVWGITDEVAWRGPVTLFDYDGQPKPAYYAVVEELKR